MSIHGSAALRIAAASTALSLAPLPATADVPGEASAEARRPAAFELVRSVPGAIAADAGVASGAACGWAGYDGATRTPLVGAAAEVRLGKRFVIGAGATYASRDDEEPAAVRPSVIARVELLSQSSRGIDLGAAAAYRQDRFVSEEGLFQATLSAGVHGDLGSVLVNLGYGQDGEGDDHLGDARLVAFGRLTGALHVGVDGHLQWLFDSTDPNRVQHRTPSLEVTVGPAVTYGAGSVMVTLEVGWSGVDLAQFQTGVIALGSVGTLF
jgi:hypothetical protein